jgi:uncharacterized iron-regulated membrane protein
VTSPALVRVHRYIALGLGFFVVTLGLSGAALVFRDELTAVVTPEVKVSSAPVGPGSFARVLAAVRRVDPAARSMDIAPAERADRATEVIIHGDRGERYLLVDPHDGAVVADGDRQWLPFATLYELHRRFLSGTPGEYVVGITGFALVFLAVSGLVMWWPRKWKHAFRIRWDGNRLAVSYDLHKCAGAAFALILVTNAVIGIAMTFDDSSVALVNRVANRAVPPIPVASANTIDSPRSLDDIVAAANDAFPAGWVSRIAISPGNTAVMVRKRLATDNDTHGMNRIWVDAGSGAVLRVSPVREQAPGNAMFEWLYPLHTGKLVGFPYRLLLVLAGCVPLLSLVTGLIVWRLRAARRMPRPAATALTTPRPSRGTS